MKNYLYQQCKN